MSATHRSIARLPLDVYENLARSSVEEYSAKDLREAILSKLKAVSRKKQDGIVVYERIATVGSILRLSTWSLLKALDPILTYAECKEFRRRICDSCAPKPTTALDILGRTRDICLLPQREALSCADRMRYLPTGLSVLDHTLGGGLRVGTVVEVVGGAGTGKSQLAMQVMVVAASLRQGAICIDTERKLSLERLKQIATARHACRDNGGRTVSNFEQQRSRSEVETVSLEKYADPMHVLDNVTIHSPSSTDELVSVLSSLDEEICVRNDEASSPTTDDRYPVRLVVLDNIAAPARRDFGSGSAPQRVAAVIQCAQILKRLADQFQLSVLVVNQVGSTGPLSSSSSALPASSSTFPSTQAALGISWHHCVSTRIQLGKANRIPNDVDATSGGDAYHERTVAVVKSNAVANMGPLPFQIADRGLISVASIN